jgi:hypothetical protein
MNIERQDEMRVHEQDAKKFIFETWFSSFSSSFSY